MDQTAVNERGPLGIAKSQQIVVRWHLNICCRTRFRALALASRFETAYPSSPSERLNDDVERKRAKAVLDIYTTASIMGIVTIGFR